MRRRGSVPPHTQSLTRRSPHWVSHGAVQMALASSLPPCPEVRRHAHGRRRWSGDIAQLCLPQGRSSISELPGLPRRPLGRLGDPGVLRNRRAFRHAVHESGRKNSKLKYFCSLACPGPSQLPCTQGDQGPFLGALMWLGAKGAGLRTWRVRCLSWGQPPYLLSGKSSLPCRGAVEWAWSPVLAT